MPEKLTYAEILADPAYMTCTCTEADCEWHGDCKSCVALHRYHATAPSCLAEMQPEIKSEQGF